MVDSGIAIGESVVDLHGKWNNNQINAKYAAEVDVNSFNELFLTSVFPEFADEVTNYIKRNK